MRKHEENQRVLLGKRIRNLRKLKHWSQQELGNYSDVNYKFIGEIERGRQSPTFDVLVKIANAFDLEISDLLRFGPEVTNRKEIEKQILQILENLPEKDLGRLLLIIRSFYLV